MTAFVPSNAPTLVERDHTSITVAWTKNSKASLYELQMLAYSDINENSNWVSLSSTLKGNFIRKRNLTDNNGYCFRVRYESTVDGSSSWSPFSPPSDALFVVSPDFQIMEAPTVATKDDVSVTLQWREVSGAIGYALRYRGEQDDSGTSSSTNGDDCWLKISSVVKGTQVRKKGLLAGTTYFFAIIPVFITDDCCDSVADSDGNVNWCYSPSSLPCRVVTLSNAMQRIFPSTLLQRANGAVAKAPTSSVLSGKCVAVYFSAHWCGPCRQFTPQLLSLYQQCKAQNKAFEIVFCSADHSEQEFNQYYGTMSWPAIDYEDDKRESMMGAFKVQGIPRLCVLGANGNILVDNAAGQTLSVSMVDQWIRMSEG